MLFSFLSPEGSRRIATVTGILLTLAMTPSAIAQTSSTHYLDVPTGAYYEESAVRLLDAGALDSSERYLRPSDLATRAELTKLLVNLKDEPLIYPSPASFSDVSRSAWYFPFMEAAAKAGWVRGDNNCYGVRRPCTARPASGVNRAEAAALLVRTFNLQRTGKAPVFSDNLTYAWYYDDVQIAADNCVLQGDSGTNRVRPSAFMNRAEMVVMFDRAYQQLRYGTDCGTTAARIDVVTVRSSSTIRVQFSQAVNITSATNLAHYTVERVSNGADVSIDTITSVNPTSVDITFNSALANGVPYQVTARNILTQAGAMFTDSERFTVEPTSARISNVTVLASDRVQVDFNTDVDLTRSEQESRYTITRSSNGAGVGIDSANRIDSNSVELRLSSALLTEVSYDLDVQSMLTSDGRTFSDSQAFSWTPQTSGHITDVTALSSNRIRFTFDIDLNRTSSEQLARYFVRDGNRELPLDSALFTENRTVELTLRESLVAQRSYSAGVRDLMSSQGFTFSDARAFIFDNPTILNFKATLNGAQEVPPTSSTATGSGTFVLTSSGLQYNISLKSLSSTGSVSIFPNITGAHFHNGAFGVSGPVLQSITFTGNHATGTWALTADQRNMLLDGNIYVNVHTDAYPNGEIRGQVIKQ